MNVYDFLQKLNVFYPTNESDKVFKERVEEYAKSIIAKLTTKKCRCDYEKVFMYILENYKYKTFPQLPDILDALPQGYRLIPTEQSADSGALIRIVMTNGNRYDYVIANFDGVNTLESIKRKFSTDIAKIIKYPQETTIIGDKVFFNIELPNAARLTQEQKDYEIARREKELKAKVKILYEKTQCELF